MKHRINLFQLKILIELFHIQILSLFFNLSYQYYIIMMQRETMQRTKINSIRQSLKLTLPHLQNSKKIEQRYQQLKLQKNKNNLDQNDSQTQSVELNDPEISSPNIQRYQPGIDSNLQLFHSKYTLLDKIGQGSNGVVKKCQDIKTGQIYAVKISQIEDQHIVNLRSMFKMVKSLNYPNIIKYKEMYINTKKHMCYLVMDYIPYPSLREIKDFNEQEIRKITKQLLRSILYMHANKVCHRDIKLDNVLFDRQNCKIYIIDFGISKKTMQRGKNKEMWSPTGTIHYKAPEMLLGGGYDQSVDVWAVGVILYQLISGYTPFYSEYKIDQIEKIRNIDYKFDEEIWSKHSKFAKDLVSKLLRDKKTRFSVQQALRVAWFLEKNDSGAMNTNSAVVLQNQKKIEDEFEILFKRNISTNISKNQQFLLKRMFTFSQIQKYLQPQLEKLRKKQDSDIITN